MTDMSKILSVLVFLVFSVSAQAGVHLGNGGDALYCPNSPVRKVDMLDRYEAEAILGLWPAFTGVNLLPMEMVDQAIDRVARLDQELANNLKYRALDFFENARFLVDANLEDIKDSHHVAIPQGCEVKQVAVQRDPLFSDMPRYIVERSLYAQMDAVNQAYLILHEAIYNLALGLGHVNSINTRYFTAVVASDKLDRMNEREWDEFLISVGFTTVHWYDAENEVLWALHEKGSATGDYCYGIAGGFRAPRLREMYAYYDNLIKSPLAEYMLANNSDAPVFTSDMAGHSPDCPQSGLNQAFVFVIPALGIDSPRRETHCRATPGPYVLCLQR